MSEYKTYTITVETIEQVVEALNAALGVTMVHAKVTNERILAAATNLDFEINENLERREPKP